VPNAVYFISTPPSPQSLAFVTQLANNLRQAGCSEELIAQFKPVLEGENPQSAYAQNIATTLQANNYSPESVQQYVNGLRAFRKATTTLGSWNHKLTNNCMNAGDKNLSLVPPEIGEAKSLKILKLWKNPNVCDLPAAIGNCKALTDITMHHSSISSLPVEMGRLNSLAFLDADYNRIERIPVEVCALPNLRVVHLSNNRLTTVPASIWNTPNLRALNLGSNQIQQIILPDRPHPGYRYIPVGGTIIGGVKVNLRRNQLSSLPPQIGTRHELSFLDLSDNRFTTVPRALFDLARGAEINMQGNPLPDAEINLVHQEMAQRRAEGRYVPHLVLPGLAAEEEANRRALVGLGVVYPRGHDARQPGLAGAAAEARARAVQPSDRAALQNINLGAAVRNRMNVHTDVLVRVFAQQIDELAEQFPTHLTGTAAQQRTEMSRIEEDLLSAINRHTPSGKNKDLATVFIKRMFEQGRGERRELHNEFDYATGRVLAYVYLGIEEQWRRTPAEHLKEAQENGLVLLVDSLAQIRLDRGVGCDTRSIQDVMQIVSTPFTAYADKNRHVIGTAPLSLSAEQVREVAFEAAKQTLREVVQRDPELANQDDEDAALRAAFKTQLTATLRAEQPLITAEQLNGFIDREIFAQTKIAGQKEPVKAWDAFKEMALQA
jgi:hypothetical protein